MPSPVGHALAGVAIGWLVERRPALLTRSGALTTAVYGIVAASPDLDLLLASHRGPTHGIGFALIAGIIAWLLTRRTRTAIAFALAYGSHVLLDWLGTDTTPPIGLMALWPLSREYYESPYHIFMAVSRRYWLPEFWTYNLRVLVRELMILGPAVLATGLLRHRVRRIVAVIVAASAFLQAQMSVPAFAQPNTSYCNALAKYRAGEYEPAVRILAALPTREIEHQDHLFDTEARKSFPRSQAAYVGLNEVLYVDTQPDLAAKAMTMLLERPAPRDPFWADLMGEWWHYDARLRAMRHGTRQ